MTDTCTCGFALGFTSKTYSAHWASLVCLWRWFLCNFLILRLLLGLQEGLAIDPQARGRIVEWWEPEALGWAALKPLWGWVYRADAQSSPGHKLCHRQKCQPFLMTVGKEAPFLRVLQLWISVLSAGWFWAVFPGRQDNCAGWQACRYGDVAFRPGLPLQLSYFRYFFTYWVQYLCFRI